MHGFRFASLLLALGFAGCSDAATNTPMSAADAAQPDVPADAAIDATAPDAMAIDAMATTDVTATDATATDVTATDAITTDRPAATDVGDAADAFSPMARRCVTGVACDATQPHCLAVDVVTHEGSVCDCVDGAFVCHTGRRAPMACPGGIGMTFTTPCSPDTLLCSTESATPFPMCQACACDATGRAWYCGPCRAIYGGVEF